jgi:type IV pilus assembly protein PilP
MTPTRKRNPVPLPLLSLALPLLLAGCGNSDVEQVQQWMAEVRSNAHVAVPKLSPPKTFVPFAYAEQSAVDPFSNSKLLTELAKVKGNGLRPDTDRRKEVLENYPLDTITMVGSIQKGGVSYAVLRIEQAVYQVRAGQYLGQNFGLVTSVGDEVVNIREIVQDATGDWVERMSKLELQESQESTK